MVRLAQIKDRIEQGGIPGLLSRVELNLTRVIEHAYLPGAFGENGIVEAIRRPDFAEQPDHQKHSLA
jgi:hypothetical protein